MAWTDPDSWATRLVSGDPWVIVFAFLTTLTLPVLLHLYFYAYSRRVELTPTFLLLGPSGGGKTSLLTLLQQRSFSAEAPEAAATRTSQIPATTRLLLPASVPLGSNKYRSKNDSALQDAEQHRVAYNMIDTPGHGKLRGEQALSHIQHSAVRGVIFVVDSGALDASDPAALRDTASYLHDMLFTLQLRKTGKGSSTANHNIPVLVAANKQDLFTALPAGAVKDRLQHEIERVKQSRRKGISTVGKEIDNDEEALGGGGEDSFSFDLMKEDFGIDVDVVGGAVKGEEAGKGVRRWEEWLGGLL